MLQHVVLVGLLCLSHILADPLAFTQDEIKECIKEMAKLDKQTYGNKVSELTTEMSAEQECLALLAHNKYRSAVHGSNIQNLQWDRVLAHTAQLWAEDCWFEHGRPGDSPEGGHTFTSFDWDSNDPTLVEGKSFGSKGGNTGQNLYFRTGVFDIETQLYPPEYIERWDSEKNYYNLATGKCSKAPCGHFTAEVWATTQYVGCGFHRCNPIDYWDNKDKGTKKSYQNANYFVCHYFPAGNWVGVKPWTPGEECGNCSSSNWCTKDTNLCATAEYCTKEPGQCECVRGTCDNGGTFDEEQCRCDCSKAKTNTAIYDGPKCQDGCKDTFGNCELYASAGYCKSYKAWMNQNCCYTCATQ